MKTITDCEKELKRIEKQLTEQFDAEKLISKKEQLSFDLAFVKAELRHLTKLNRDLNKEIQEAEKERLAWIEGMEKTKKDQKEDNVIDRYREAIDAWDASILETKSKLQKAINNKFSTMLVIEQRMQTVPAVNSIPNIAKLDVKPGIDKTTIGEDNRLQISGNHKKDLAILIELTKNDKNIKIQRFYERDGKTPRAKMVKLEKQFREDPSRLSFEQQLSILFKLNFSVFVDENHIPFVLYEGKKKQLGEGSDANVKYTQNLITGEFKPTRITKKGEYGSPKEVQQIARERGLLENVFEREEYGVVRTYEVQKYAGRRNLFFQVELDRAWCDNIPLDRVIDFDERLDIAIQMFEKMAELHKAKIVHCDIKPDNILYDENTKELTIIDYNSAIKISDENAIITLENQKTTGRYRAPETENSDGTYSYSIKGDVYSGGVSLMDIFQFKKDSHIPPNNSYEASIHQKEIIQDENPEIEELRKNTLLKIKVLIKNMTAQSADRACCKDSDAIKELVAIKKKYQEELQALRLKVLEKQQAARFKSAADSLADSAAQKATTISNPNSTAAGILNQQNLEAKKMSEATTKVHPQGDQKPKNPKPYQHFKGQS